MTNLLTQRVRSTTYERRMRLAHIGLCTAFSPYEIIERTINSVEHEIIVRIVAESPILDQEDETLP